MPLPTPTRDENREDFISRCMANRTMRREFKQREQRLAVCNGQWRRGQRQQREGGDESLEEGGA